MTYDKYSTYKKERDALVEELVSLCGEENRKTVERLMAVAIIVHGVGVDYMKQRR